MRTNTFISIALLLLPTIAASSNALIGSNGELKTADSVRANAVDEIYKTPHITSAGKVKFSAVANNSKPGKGARLDISDPDLELQLVAIEHALIRVHYSVRCRAMI